MQNIQLHCFYFGNCYFLSSLCACVHACLCPLTETCWTTCVYKRWQQPYLCPPPRACGTAPWLWGSSLGSPDTGQSASKVAALCICLHWSIGSQNVGSRTFTHFVQLQPCRRGSPAHTRLLFLSIKMHLKILQPVLLICAKDTEKVPCVY